MLCFFLTEHSFGVWPLAIQRLSTAFGLKKTAPLVWIQRNTIDPSFRLTSCFKAILMWLGLYAIQRKKKQLFEFWSFLLTCHILFQQHFTSCHCLIFWSAFQNNDISNDPTKCGFPTCLCCALDATKKGFLYELWMHFQKDFSGTQI